jgi:hypothetical protein
MYGRRAAELSGRGLDKLKAVVDDPEYRAQILKRAAADLVGTVPWTRTGMMLSARVLSAATSRWWCGGGLRSLPSRPRRSRPSAWSSTRYRTVTAVSIPMHVTLTWGAAPAGSVAGYACAQLAGLNPSRCRVRTVSLR